MITRRTLTALPVVLAMTVTVQAQVLETGPAPGDDVFSVPPGSIEQAVAALPDIATRVMERSGVPGMAIAVVQGSDILFAEGFGVRNLDTGAPITPETVFQVASLSKPMSATVAAIAVGRGIVDWDDRVRDLMPDYRLASDYVTTEATIGDFFAHRSGLPRAAGDDLEDLGYDRATILSRLHLLTLDSFRTSYNYANFGTTTAGEAVAAAAGQPWEDLADAYLFDPLGMEHTSYRHDDFTAEADTADLHSLEGDHFAALYERDPDQQAPAGGVSSNVLDLSRWLRLLLGGGSFDGTELFEPEDILPALKPQTQSSPGHSVTTRSGGYGYAFNNGVSANGMVMLSHSGAFVLGAGTAFTVVPGLDTGIVVLTNGGPVGAAEAVVSEFFDLALYGEVTRDWYAGYNRLIGRYQAPVGDLVGQEPPQDPAPSRPLAELAGTYDNPYFGPARIEAEADGLVLYLGPEDMAFPLQHWTGDTFAIAPRNENAPLGTLSSATFGEDDSGRQTLHVDFFDQQGLGTWKR